MSVYLGDLTPGKTVRRKFNTHKADGTPITLAGTPAAAVYKGSPTESTAGVTLTVDYDARTGLHDVVVDTSADGTFYAAGNDFDIVLTAGTVDSISVVGTVLATFSIGNRSALRPTTADRTLDVAATGEAGLDFDNIKAATGATTLTNITVPVVTTLTGHTAQTGDAFARIGATGSGLTSLAPSSTALSTAQWTTPRAAALDNLDAAVTTRMATYAQPTGFLAATFPGTVASPTNITAGTLTTVTNLTNLPTIPTNWLTAAGLAADAGAEIAAAVWDLATTGHTTSGTFGAAMGAAGAAGDPWSTSLPGSYGAGTAGLIVGTTLAAGVTTLLSRVTGTIPTAAQNAAGLLDLADGVEAGLTPRQALRVIAAAAGGEVSGAGTAEVTITGAGVGTTRVVADVDVNGNRTNVTLTP